MWRRAFPAVFMLAVCGLPSLRAAITDMTCEADASQRYALYLPSNYSADREWNLILAFDAGARGRLAVERLQAAAEKYGYVVAGSYNSKNGPWGISLGAAAAMKKDVLKRYKINPKRIYTAGQSGGARVAMRLARDGGIAGVIASSAGFPDPSDAPKTLPFPVFGTAGTEDFNYTEMRDLDSHLTSPHRVEIFEGGHQWLPSELAVKAVGWLEVQAIKSGASPANEALLDKIFEARVADAKQKKTDFETWRADTQLSQDFQGLEDVKQFYQDAIALMSDAKMRNALNAEIAEVNREKRLTNELFEVVQTYAATPSNGIGTLRTQVEKYAAQAKATEDSSDRRMARRILAGLAASSRGIDDADFQKLIDGIRPPRVQ
jgi:dienelactone hydrolase